MAETLPADQKAIPRFLKKLQSEHAYSKSLLDIASESQALLAANEEPDLDILEEVLHYLADYPQDYHHPREDLMFKRMIAKDAKTKKVIEPLLRDHEAMHGDNHELHSLVYRAKAGKYVSKKKLAGELQRFLTDYKKHMQEEETKVFPLAVKTLTQKDWDDLAEGMEAIQDPLFGTRVQRRYQRLADYLTARFDVAKRDFAVTQFMSVRAVVDGMILMMDTSIDVTTIVGEKTLKNLRDNVVATRQSLSSGNPADLCALPARYFENTRRCIESGFRECSESVSRSIDELADPPYEERINTVKSLLREEWNQS